MGTVEFQSVESQPGGTVRARNEGRLDSLDSREIERLRRCLVMAVRQGGRRNRSPAAPINANQLPSTPGYFARALPSRVADLDGELDGRDTAHCVDDSPQRVLVFIRVKPEASRRYPSGGFDCGGLDAKHPGPPEREMAEMHFVPPGCGSVHRGVLAHGRNHDPVGQLESSKLNRRKQGARHLLSLFDRWELEVGQENGSDALFKSETIGKKSDSTSFFDAMEYSADEQSRTRWCGNVAAAPPVYLGGIALDIVLHRYITPLPLGFSSGPRVRWDGFH